MVPLLIGNKKNSELKKLKGIFPIVYAFFNKNNTLDTKLIEEQIKLIKKNEDLFWIKDLLNNTGVVLLPGSDFGILKNKMIARLSFTDFNGEDFMKNVLNNENINLDIIAKFAPKIAEGTKRLKDWAKSN